MSATSITEIKGYQMSTAYSMTDTWLKKYLHDPQRIKYLYEIICITDQIYKPTKLAFSDFSNLTNTPLKVGSLANI